MSKYAVHAAVILKAAQAGDQHANQFYTILTQITEAEAPSHAYNFLKSNVYGMANQAAAMAIQMIAADVSNGSEAKSDFLRSIGRTPGAKIKSPLLNR